MKPGTQIEYYRLLHRSVIFRRNLNKENRLGAGFTVRVYGRHALGLQYSASVRDAQYPDRADSHQSVGTVSLVFTLLGKAQFGAVEWRGTDYL
jgi:hypothetical protein